MMSDLLIGFIRLYQRWLSPLLGRHCRFEPSCSQYAAEAIKLHGAIKGVGLAAWRLLRCQPFCKGGYDPVPPAKSAVVRTAGKAPVCEGDCTCPAPETGWEK